MNVLKRIAVLLGLRPRWLTEKMEEVIADSLSGTEPGSTTAYIPPYASLKDRVLCRAVHYFFNGNDKKLVPIYWTDEDAEGFLKSLLVGDLNIKDPAKEDTVNSESVAVFKAIHLAFSSQNTPSSILLDRRFISLISSFTLTAIQYDSFERMNDPASRALLVNSLVELMHYIRLCIREGQGIRIMHGSYFVGELGLPDWLVEKYRTPKTPKKT